MRVEAFLKDSARRLPDQTAVISGNGRITYGQLDAASGNLAACLVREGILPGDRLIIFMSNRLEAVTSIFAAQKAGAVFSLIHPSTKSDKLAYTINDCQAAALITEDRLAPGADNAIAQTSSVQFMINVGDRVGKKAQRTILFDNAISTTSGAPDNPGIDIDLSMLIYTSGSTGRPKGVMMTHQNVVAAEQAIAAYLPHDENDIIFNVLPISSSYGINQVLMAVRTGATLVLEKSFAFPYAVLEKLGKEKATGFPLVPTMAALILQLKNIKPGDFPHLRYITNAAAALPVSHIQKLQNLFPDTSIYSMYGQTECKRSTWMPPELLTARPASVGIAIPGTQAYIVDDEGKRVMPGETGELVIRGAHVMKGYWNNPKETQKALKPGPLPNEKVLYTGDLFYADEDHFLYFVARKDDIIKTRGEKVAPMEVETILHELSDVSEAIIIGIPDPLLGQVIRAVVVPSEGAKPDERAILRHCAQRLEDFMVPTRVEFRKELPKSANGKIQRRLVKQEILENMT